MEIDPDNKNPQADYPTEIVHRNSNKPFHDAHEVLESRRERVQDNVLKTEVVVLSAGNRSLLIYTEHSFHNLLSDRFFRTKFLMGSKTSILDIAPFASLNIVVRNEVITYG